MSVLGDLRKAIQEWDTAVQEASLYRWRELVYKKYGFIVISAERGEIRKGEHPEQNTARTASLLRDIEATGYQYYPADGFYKEIYKAIENDEVKEVEVPVIENSFVVVNVKKVGDTYEKGLPENFEELKELGIQWCLDYDQDTVLVVPPGGRGTFYNNNGYVDPGLGAMGDGKGEDFHSFAGRNNREDMNYVTFLPKRKSQNKVTKDGKRQKVRNRGFMLGTRDSFLANVGGKEIEPPEEPFSFKNNWKMDREQNK